MKKGASHFGVSFLYILLTLSLVVLIQGNENEEVSQEESNELPEEEIEINYVAPKAQKKTYLFETLDDIADFEKKWVKSKAKKDEVDEDISKYDGIWSLDSMEKDALIGDRGLILKSKAKHAAISVKLNRPFVFKDKPFVVQYEVNLQNGQECGGAYIKLLSNADDGLDLNKFNDKTPYTIMFGPDKCGNDHKLHFIFRHVNPITKAVEEKHCKRPKDKIEEVFKDKRPHLYTLILRPDNTFEILLDHQVINSGHLLEDFTPSVNPEKEIDDPNDVKPTHWDEQEKIPDPNSQKPEDWDEEAPRQIVDQFAVKPDGWQDDELDLIPDPEAAKPEDWDDEMDGEWEAPLVSNPKCEAAPGCGKWKEPLIDNPNYKGKWKALMINNPNYKGKWTPRRIHNPDYFEDLEPFKMTSIGAVGLELWSMSDGIYFDNFLISESMDEAVQIASETFDLKISKLMKGQKGYVATVVDFSNTHPWIYGVYVLALAIPVVLIFVCCCAEDVKEDKDAIKKKTDEPTEDDEEVKEEKENEGEDEAVEGGGGKEEEEEGEEGGEGEGEGGEGEGGEGEGGEGIGEEEDEEDEEDDDEDEDDENDEDDDDVDVEEDEDEEEDETQETTNKSGSEVEVEKSDEETRKSPRLRKVRKE